jgi:cytochrome c oxidase subunit IV
MIEDSMAEHIITRKTYFLIWVILMLLTALTAFASLYDLGPFSAVVAVVIACTKATIIALFFMHMKYADKVTRLAGLVSLLFLGIMFVLTSTDFFTRKWSTFPLQ